MCSLRSRVQHRQRRRRVAAGDEAFGHGVDVVVEGLGHHAGWSGDRGRRPSAPSGRRAGSSPEGWSKYSCRCSATASGSRSAGNTSTKRNSCTLKASSRMAHCEDVALPVVAVEHRGALVGERGEDLPSDALGVEFVSPAACSVTSMPASCWPIDRAASPLWPACPGSRIVCLSRGGASGRLQPWSPRRPPRATRRPSTLRSPSSISTGPWSWATPSSFWCASCTGEGRSGGRSSWVRHSGSRATSWGWSGPTTGRGRRRHGSWPVGRSSEIEALMDEFTRRDAGPAPPPGGGGRPAGRSRPPAGES